MTVETSQSIPTEKGWPLLGILPKFLSGDSFEYLKNVMLKQGDFVQINFGTKPVYLVSHPDYLKRILRDNYQNYRKPEIFYGASREVSGNGLLNSSGEFWLRQRRMIQPHLHRKQLESLFSDMVDAIAEVLNRWETLAQDGAQIEVGEKMAEITINVISHTMFGKGILPESDVNGIGLRASRMVKYIGGTLYSVLLPKWFPIPGRREFEQDRLKTKETIHYIIEKCRNEKERSASLIQMLINSVDEESHEQMTEQQLFDEVMTIFVAGYETTATALTWLSVILEKNPKVLEGLYTEFDQVLQGRIPSFEDIPRLVYTRKVFMEVLRMYTIAPFLPRELNEADQLGNYQLPADALILVFYHGVHHNPRVWENPEVFDPERFTPDAIASQPAFSYVPFSAGPRKCVGDEFALLEGPLIMAMLLQKYRLKILPDQIFSSRLGGTMQPSKGVRATLFRRPS